MGIDLQQKIDLVVLSHGHWDHGNGLRFLQNKPLICHPSAFMKRFGKSDGRTVGLALGKEELQEKFDVTTSNSPINITDKIIFLGEIPRQKDFEAQATVFADGQGNDDFVPDDSALAIIKEEKLVIISGCAHAGICNICDYAMQVTGIQAIGAVIGGFHLLRSGEQTTRTIAYFQEKKVPRLFPSHCTALPALAAFHQAFGTRQLKTGDVISDW